MTLLNYYRIPSEIPKIICDEIIKKYYNEDELNIAEVGKNGGVNSVNYKYRKSKVFWINNDTWIAGMLAHFANSANSLYFNFDIDGFRKHIQFTVYDSEGDYYGWHIDVDNESLSEKLTRKLSIVMCLSSKDDYEGGEFELYWPSSTMKETIKLDCGEVIVFPSILQHRVRPIKSGKRFSLVGWMGGPPFK
jgi:PKHD-type hydroxylase